MRGDVNIYNFLSDHQIDFEYYEHLPIPTIDLAMEHKKGIDATHCKNLFLRNHKGKRHYFVVIEQSKIVNITQLELFLKQGKLSFASAKRLQKYLGVKPGAVSPLGLIYDIERNSKVFVDVELEKAKKLSFHPNISNASLVIETKDLERFFWLLKIEWEYIDLS